LEGTDVGLSNNPLTEPAETCQTIAAGHDDARPRTVATNGHRDEESQCTHRGPAVRRVPVGRAHNSGSVVSWRNIFGVITAPAADNPVAVTTDDHGNVLNQIQSGTLPWITRAGYAQVDLANGALEFSVRGLVLIGGNASGTAGPINQVTGTLVCNPGSRDVTQPQAILDTPPVALSALGNASFWIDWYP
jgi:hypothetical protein